LLGPAITGLGVLTPSRMATLTAVNWRCTATYLPSTSTIFGNIDDSIEKCLLFKDIYSVLKLMRYEYPSAKNSGSIVPPKAVKHMAINLLPKPSLPGGTTVGPPLSFHVSAT
jgi:hypothetical protein